ncbi:glutathione peroxidase [Alkalilimnicola ehrlichii]|uniref:Glutathione peroxidase n=1 Tax=Alkalilimnicola ehrlichii TaxID=351052 RepID=A0A3E0WJL5_9GAMM|nr:glutathione peroxidase [Alkalilimnicola ehrlichii]RFA24491.1 glutathione peroxidase [Alkalilimnicola ehrlichii]RFA32156.1 glutathione peroxidase [Alkalilimnicola ehrlichii]
MMLENREGQRVPDATFRTRSNGQWTDVTSDELFKGRTVVLFALPGAFTPTCSSTHLPRYEELVEVFKANGVDEIVCLSVNDAFVMEAWGKDQGADKVRLIPDGNGEFSAGMGMLVDKSDLGFGKRSWRYSMLVKDGVIEKQFIEPDKPGDPFEVSDADTMLRYINEAAEVPEPVTMFTRVGCPHCARAKRLLAAEGIDFDEIRISSDVTPRTLDAIAGARTVPQIFIGGRRVGGADDLEKYLQR